MYLLQGQDYKVWVEIYISFAVEIQMNCIDGIIKYSLHAPGVFTSALVRGSWMRNKNIDISALTLKMFNMSPGTHKHNRDKKIKNIEIFEIKTA